MTATRTVQLTIPATWYVAPDSYGDDAIWDADTTLAWPSEVMPERGRDAKTYVTLRAALIAALPRMEWAVYNGASVCTVQPYATEAQARLSARLLIGEMDLALEADPAADADPDAVYVASRLTGQPWTSEGLSLHVEEQLPVCDLMADPTEAAATLAAAVQWAAAEAEGRDHAAALEREGAARGYLIALGGVVTKEGDLVGTPVDQNANPKG